MARFEVEDLIAECVGAVAEAEPRRAVREVLERTMSAADDVAAVMAPTEAGVTLLHQGDDITVMHVVWAPGMSIFPHDHRMWAAIGIYAGREDNAFYRRPAPDATTIVASGGKRLDTGDAVVLGDDTIHGVTNPLRAYTGAIHVYGGDFVNEPRSAWGPGPLEERPYDLEATRREFAAANSRWKQGG